MHGNQNSNEAMHGADLIAMHQTALPPTPDADAPDAQPDTASDTATARSAIPLQLDLAKLTKRQRAGRRIRTLAVRADYRLQDRVRHPDGGDISVAELIKAEKAQRSQIEREAASGSDKHRRVQRWVGWMPRLVLCFDFGLLMYFFAGITNVDWSDPMSIAMAFALILAAMVTVLSYGYLAFTGHRLRTHKNHAGTVHGDELDGFTRLVVAVAVVVIGVIATLMYLRMHTEVGYALGSGSGLTALAIATALAVINAAANFLVVAIHALDGSDQVARLEKISAAARRPYAKAQRMREEAAVQHAQDDQHEY